MSTALCLDSPEALYPYHPLLLAWEEADLPRRVVRAPGGKSPPREEAPPWLASGPADAPFDFCAHVSRLCADIVARCDEFRHIEVERLLFAVTQARNGRPRGLQARVTPLRFPQGHLVSKRRGIHYQVQRYRVGSQEKLYLVTFCLPRFLDQGFDEKFVTLFHELYHISPAFDGDLRRHRGRCSVHSGSKRAYDAHMADLAREYLQNGADRRRHDFLRLTFAQLQGRHGAVTGVTVPKPKVIPIRG